MMLDINKIKERLAKATPGPWRVGVSALITDGNGHALFFGNGAKDNADFIAQARQDIPDLIAEVERLQKELDNKNTTLSVLKKRFIQHIEELAEFRLREREQTCLWEEDADGVWGCSACGADWILEDGTPFQNEMSYCPVCGAYITEEKVYREDDGNE